MIFGKVWAVTWEGSMTYDGNNNGKKGLGRLMIIKDMNKPILYLLAHLYSCRKKEGDYVYPGEIVALTGSIGNSAGEHLHLEVFECEAPDTKAGRDSFLFYDPRNLIHNLPYEEGSNPSIHGLNWKIDQREYRRNALDHSEKYIY